MAGPAILKIDIISDASKAQAGLKSTEGAVSKTTAKVKTSLLGLASTMGVAFGSAAVIGGIKDSVTAASNLNETISKTQQVFGPASKSIESWSKTSASAFGQSQQQALDAASAFGIFGLSAGLTGPKLVSFSTGMTKLASDMASFSNTTPGEAIDALGAALRGESEPIRKYGVLLNEQVLKNRAIHEGIAKAVVDASKVKQANAALVLSQTSYNAAVAKYGPHSAQAQRAALALAKAHDAVKKASAGTVAALTPQQRILAAQKEIYAQTGKAQGDFARTSDGLANKQRILSANIENAKATLGNALLPTVLSATQAIMTFGHEVIQAAQWIKQNADVILVVVGALTLMIVVTNAARIAQAAYNAVMLIYRTVTVNAAAAMYILNAAMAANPVGLIIVAIIALVALFVILYMRCDTFRAIVQSAMKIAAAAFGWVVSAAKAVFNWIASHWPLLVAILTGPIGIAVLLIAKNWDTIKAGASALFGFFATIAGRIASALAGVAHAIASPFIAGFSAVRSAVESAVHYVTGLIDSLKHAVSGGIEFAKGVYNTFARTWNGVQVGVDAVKIAGKTVVPGFTFGLPDIPLLASGAYTTRPMLGVFGEGGAEYALPERMLRAELARAGGNTYQITVNVPVGANPAEIGRTLVDNIRAFERSAGTSWRAVTA